MSDWRDDFEIKLFSLGILPEDIGEKFTISRGPGGQHANKAATCVVLTHLPSGLTVKCQEERSQLQNRLRARAILIEKLSRKLKEERAKLIQAEQKKKRQNRLRSRAAKLRNVEFKRKLSLKKKLRSRVRDNEEF